MPALSLLPLSLSLSLSFPSALRRVCGSQQDRSLSPLSRCACIGLQPGTSARLHRAPSLIKEQFHLSLSLSLFLPHPLSQFLPYLPPTFLSEGGGKEERQKTGEKRGKRRPTAQLYELCNSAGSSNRNPALLYGGNTHRVQVQTNQNGI